MYQGEIGPEHSSCFSKTLVSVCGIWNLAWVTAFDTPFQPENSKVVLQGVHDHVWPTRPPFTRELALSAGQIVSRNTGEGFSSAIAIDKFAYWSYYQPPLYSFATVLANEIYDKVKLYMPEVVKICRSLLTYFTWKLCEAQRVTLALQQLRFIPGHHKLTWLYQASIILESSLSPTQVSVEYPLS